MATKTRPCRYTEGQAVEVFVTQFVPLAAGSKFSYAVERWVTTNVVDVEDFDGKVWQVRVRLPWGQWYCVLVGPRGGNNLIREAKPKAGACGVCGKPGQLVVDVYQSDVKDTVVPAVLCGGCEDDAEQDV